MMHLLALGFASSQSAEVGVGFVAPAVEEGTDYKPRSAVLLQEVPRWLPKASYHTACTAFESFHK